MTPEQLRWKKLTVAKRALLARLAKIEPMPPEEILRASGQSVCVNCDLMYVDHPDHPFAPTFTILCSGEIVKT